MRRVLSFAVAAGLVLMGAREIPAQTPAPQASAPKATAPSEPRFYTDDPLAAEPTPIAVPEPRNALAVARVVRMSTGQRGVSEPATEGAM
jgi:hypothetical protein